MLVLPHTVVLMPLCGCTVMTASSGRRIVGLPVPRFTGKESYPTFDVIDRATYPLEFLGKEDEDDDFCMCRGAMKSPTALTHVSTEMRSLSRSA